MGLSTVFLYMHVLYIHIALLVFLYGIYPSRHENNVKTLSFTLSVTMWCHILR